MSAPLALRVERIALVGLPGAGKSAVGAALARRTGWRLVDLDAEVARRAGRRVQEIIDGEGDEAFRAREREAVLAVLDEAGPLVLACGGGTLTRPEVREALLQRICTVWLDAPDEVLLRRLGDAADRPLLRADPGGRLAELRAGRTAAYARAPLHVDSGDGDVEEICDRVLDAVAGARLAIGGAAVGEGDEFAVPGARVIVAARAVARIAEVLPPGAGHVAVVADRAVAPLAAAAVAALEASGRRTTLLSVDGGEGVKTWDTAGRLLTELAEARLERSDAVVAVGGGTVGDLAGFVAATYHRGIACVQVPTTLLAMVDSAIGGKTGVNLPQGKNLAGAFHQPHAVVCDLEALRTVPDRPYRAAFAEILKYPMVLDDTMGPVLDATLDALLARDLDALRPLVARCCALKAEVVRSDERESGRRAILNYGHTVGHALEAMTGFGDELLHGEAVALGMRVAGRLSTAVLGCPAGDVAWQDEMLARCGLGRASPAVDAGAVLERTRGDKKARGGAARWVLLRRRGVAEHGHLVPDDSVRAALREVLAA